MRYAVLFFFFFFFSLDFPNGASSGEARHVGSDGRFHRISMIGSSVGQWPTAAPRSAVAVAATRAPISVQQPNGRQIKRQNMELMGWGWRGNDDQKKKGKETNRNPSGRVEIDIDEPFEARLPFEDLPTAQHIERSMDVDSVDGVWTFRPSHALELIGRSRKCNRDEKERPIRCDPEKKTQKKTR